MKCDSFSPDFDQNNEMDFLQAVKDGDVNTSHTFTTMCNRIEVA